MKIHHLRNATLVIESQNHFILLDPMLGGAKSMPSFTLFRHKRSRNPLVELPGNAPELLQRVTHCLITHSRALGIKALQHTDHLDRDGENFLLSTQTPVGCIRRDAGYLRKYGLRVESEFDFWQARPYLGGTLTAVPAQHGYGWIRFLMANGAGFYLELPGEPSVYFSGDTVYTPDVKKALTELRPDLAVVAAGQAQLDVGKPLLMTIDDVLSFVEDAPGQVVANHLESLNHCPVTRESLYRALQERGLESKVIIPEDGETIDF